MDELSRAAINRASAALNLINPNNERERRARNYVRSVIARVMRFADVSDDQPEAIARALWGEHEVEAIAKAAIGAITSTQTAESVAFFGLAGEASILGKLPLRRWPFDVRTLASSGVTGGEVDEGEGTPIRASSLTSFRLTPRKFQSAVVVTRESLQRGGNAFESGLQGDLIKAAADALDAALVSDLIAAEDSNGFAGDHRFAVFLMNPQDAAENADERLDVRGGWFRGYPAYVTPAVTPGSAIFFDASKVAADWAGGEIDFSNQALIEASDTPAADSVTPTAAEDLISLFQTNSVAIRSTMQAGWHIEDGAIEVVSLGS